jgi:hypothetical protein
MLHPIAPLLKPKLKYWICTTTTDHPPRTIWLQPSTTIKRSSQSEPLSTTQRSFHFASSLARAPCHQSFTHCCRSHSPPSHTHHPSAQWHPRWWTIRPSFTSQTTYRYVNSRKKIFWNLTAWHSVGGNPSPTTKGYLRRPPQVGALHPQCFCVCSICSPVVEDSRGSPLRARVKGYRPTDLRRLKPKGTSCRCHHHQGSKATTLPRTCVSISFDTLCNNYLM